PPAFALAAASGCEHLLALPQRGTVAGKADMRFHDKGDGRMHHGPGFQAKVPITLLRYSGGRVRADAVAHQGAIGPVAIDANVKRLVVGQQVFRKIEALDFVGELVDRQFPLSQCKFPCEPEQAEEMLAEIGSIEKLLYRKRRGLSSNVKIRVKFILKITGSSKGHKGNAVLDGRVWERPGKLDFADGFACDRVKVNVLRQRDR